LLHTMVRVGNLEQSLRFYCEGLGMRLLRLKDYPGGRFTLAFVGYGPEAEQTVIELTHNWDTDRYDVGAGFGQLALCGHGVYAKVEELRDAGVKVTGEPGLMNRGGSTIAFVEDPNGYKIELIELDGRTD